MSKESFEKMLERKRNSNINIDIDKFNEIKEPEKKYNSAENKKLNDLKIKQISNFMARIDEKYENNIFKEEEKLSGDKLNFELRKKKAAEIIDSTKNSKDFLALIKESLVLDNTNKIYIYKLLKYYYENNDKTNFNETIKEYKFCITKEINFIEKEENICVNLNKFFEIEELIEEKEELPNHMKNEINIVDLRNSLVDIFTSYYYISKGINDIKGILSYEELNEILSVKYAISSSNNTEYALFYEKEKKLQIFKNHKEINEETANNILTKIEKFLCRYLFNFDFMFFQHNQPIDYNNNLSLFYNFIIYSIYELALEIDEKGKKIILKSSKLKKYKNQEKLHELLFDDFFDKEKPLNETMNLLLQFLLLIISSEKKTRLKKFVNFIHLEETDKTIDESSIEEFIKNLNQKYDFFIAKNKNERIIFEEKNTKSSYDKIEIDLKNYSKEIFELPNLKSHEEIDFLWEKILFEKFQTVNFFIEKDIKYLKYLLKHILSSNLYKTIFENFNNVSNVVDYYFNNEKNIDDYIKRIYFLPFRVKDLGKFGITNRHSLTILVSGYPEKEINDLEDYRIFRIIELALRIIILAGHEPPHFIKSAYNMLTGGIITRNTSNDDKNIESGYFLEEVLFGWIKDEKNPLDLKDLILNEKEINYKNLYLKEKKIDLITAIQILNPDIYDENLTTFRKELFEINNNSLKNFKFSSIKNQEYKAYLESVLDEKLIQNLEKDDYYTVNASMGLKDDFCISYMQYNHNIDRIDY